MHADAVARGTSARISGSGSTAPGRGRAEGRHHGADVARGELRSSEAGSMRPRASAATVAEGHPEHAGRDARACSAPAPRRGRRARARARARPRAPRGWPSSRPPQRCPRCVCQPNIRAICGDRLLLHRELARPPSSAWLLGLIHIDERIGQARDRMRRLEHLPDVERVVIREVVLHPTRRREHRAAHGGAVARRWPRAAGGRTPLRAPRGPRRAGAGWSGPAS